MLDDENLVGHSYNSVSKMFPQVKVVDIGSTDTSLTKVPKKCVIKAGKQTHKSYIELKNELSAKHDQVVWIDSDEIYPESSLKLLSSYLEQNPERIYSYWRNVRIDTNRQIFIEKPFMRGYCAWKTSTNKLWRDWPNEHLLNVDPSWTPYKYKFDNPKLWCWHGVLLRRSSLPEPTGRRKKRLYRLDEANKRKTWTIHRFNDMPWSDADLDKYII